MALDELAMSTNYFAVSNVQQRRHEDRQAVPTALHADATPCFFQAFSWPHRAIVCSGGLV